METNPFPFRIRPDLTVRGQYIRFPLDVNQYQDSTQLDSTRPASIRLNKAQQSKTKVDQTRDIDDTQREHER